MKVLKTRYLFVFLLPVFFVLHGLNEYLFFVPVSSAFRLLLTYLAGGIVCWLLFFLIYRDNKKAMLAVFVSLMFFFFFGWIHDVLRSLAAGSFLTKYSVLLSVLGISYVFLLLLIRKKKPAPTFLFYLNTLFFLLIAIDVAGIAYKTFTKPEIQLAPPCASCEKPDVHFIILDGFAGRDQLTGDLNFTDSGFFSSLREQGFNVIDHSRSNYTVTALSVASILNMEYHTIETKNITDDVLNYCYRKISQNKVTAGFKNQGYRFVNNSIFDVGEQPSLSVKTFLISGADLIASQTLYGRLKRDLYQNFIWQYFPGSGMAKQLVFADKKNNDLLFERLKRIVREDTMPVFSYTHLMMPHFPYYYKADGSLNSMEDLDPRNLSRTDLYLGYLKYTGNKITGLTSEIIRYGKKNKVIIVLSDHGYTHSDKKQFHSSTIAAIYRTDRNYGMYNDSVSNVNQFRILFNSLFHQNNALLPHKE
jgi:hypothetical protein